MIGFPTLCFMVSLYSRIAISFPFYEPFHHNEYEADHAATVAEVDRHSVDIPYLDSVAANFDKATGEGYDDAHYSNAGQKGDRGYDKYDGYETGVSGQRGANGQKTRYNNAGGQRSGHRDNSDYYNDRHAVVKGSKGGDFAVNDSYNKGSKTTGFHNVHHKEEYQKNRKFYDEANKSGHYARYGDFGAALLAAAGGGSAGNRYNQGYGQADFGKRGFSERGSLYNDLKQYAGANGNDGYHRNHQDYGSAGGVGHKQNFGYLH